MERWTPKEARQHRLIAQRIYSVHDHNPSDRDKLTRENCAACILHGYRPQDSELKRSEGPNYAGWARILVEAGVTIPAVWREAFAAERASDNHRYAEALERSILTYGVRMEGDTQ